MRAAAAAAAVEEAGVVALALAVALAAALAVAASAAMLGLVEEACVEGLPVAAGECARGVRAAVLLRPSSLPLPAAKAAPPPLALSGLPPAATCCCCCCCCGSGGCSRVLEVGLKPPSSPSGSSSNPPWLSSRLPSRLLYTLLLALARKCRARPGWRRG